MSLLCAYDRDTSARANFRFNQKHMRQLWQRPGLNVELTRICGQLRARTRRREVQASIAVAKIIVALDRSAAGRTSHRR